ncbi:MULTISPECIES: G5 and 3D domain-containing protein [Allobacillus]|uniref:DUF348 domain-containing protein n=1 Tax=Allobacillus salarius TaxID=1955272 RepID=A0A556PBM7_9BACI|nr:G5 and 3D domain-containing protein [Allobacillus salarius]TSJ61797.1 DUF348 domain-containing protein [Allobacillus salarius]
MNSKNTASKRFGVKGFIILSLTIVAMASLFFIVYESMKKEVTVLAGEEKHETNTMAKTVEEVLNELGVERDEHDYLSEDLTKELEDGMEIELDYSNEVVVTIDDETETYHTFANTAEEFLEEENIEVNEHDHLSFDLEEELSDGRHLAISKAFEVVINDGGEKKTVMTTGQTIQSLLAKEGIKLTELDQLNMEPTKELESNEIIKITRVDKEKKTYDEIIPYNTKTESDDSLEKGKTRIVQKGKEGKKVQTFEITYKNGEEVFRELVSEEITEESQNRVVAQGTKEPPKQTVAKKSSNNVQQTSAKSESTVKTKETNQEEGQTMIVQATAYSTNNPSLSTHTATGIDLRSNPRVIAVDPSVIPLGSKVWVEGYGMAIAGDTGGAIKGKKIDIHFSSYEKAKSFGRKTVRIKVY